jgi:hypothetical protein
MIAGGNFAAFPLLGFTSGEDRVSFAGALEDDPTADLVVPFIFAGFRGGVVRAIGRAIERRAAFFLVVTLTALREADFLVGLATEKSNSFHAGRGLFHPPPL